MGTASTKTPTYYEKIELIVTFFYQHKGNSGWMFCAIDHEGLKEEINHTLTQRLENKNGFIKILNLPLNLEDNFVNHLRPLHEEGFDGIVINNLDALIRDKGEDFIEQMNFAREMLWELNMPLLIWITSANLPLFSHYAPDFWSRRSSELIQFDNPSSTESTNKLREFFPRDIDESGDSRGIVLKIEVLEKQLKEGNKKGFPVKKLVNDIVIPLIRNYLRAFCYKEAKELFEQYKSYFQLSDNTLHVSIAAELYHYLHQLERAKGYYETLLNIYEQRNLLVEKVETYNKLGLLAFDEGDFDKAIKLINYSIWLLESKNLKEEKLKIATFYCNLGLAWSEKGNYDKAIDNYEIALSIHKEILGTNHSGTADDYNNLGLAWNYKGYYDKAIKYYEKALEINKKVLNETHPAIAKNYNNLGLALKNKGEYEQALKYHEKAYEIEKVIFGANHPNTSLMLSNIASVYEHMADYDKAIKYYKKVLNIDKAIFKTNHPSLARDLNNLGSALEGKGNYRIAIKKYEQALRIAKNSLGKEHPNTKIVKRNLELAKDRRLESN